MARPEFVTAIGGNAAARIKDVAWYPYKLDLPKIKHGMDHDFAVSFPNPLEPYKCYQWDQAHMEKLANMRDTSAGDLIPALFRVHTADVLIHEVTSEGFESVLGPNDMSSFEGKEAGYMRFTLYKEGLRTTQAVYFAAKITGIPLTSFSWSVGMDSKAATSQDMTLDLGDNPQETISAFMKMLSPEARIPRGVIRIGSIRYSEEAIAQGSTRGKRVAMLLRNVRAGAQELNTRMEDVRSGFVNYFGVEKFGVTQGVRPHNVAASVLTGRFRDAFFAILEMEAFMNPTVSRIKHNIETREQVTDGMVEKVPSHLPHVKSLLYGLMKYKSFKLAYYSVAPAMRKMWESSLPALIWNKLATTRIENYGKELVVGDVVWIKGEGRAHTATEEDVANGMYSIYDVVIPVPGVPCYENETSFYPSLEGCDFNAVMDALEEHGAPFPFRLPQEHTAIFPTYRHLLTVPLGLRWEVFEHEAVNERVIATDPHAYELDVYAGDVVSCNDKRVSYQNPLQTKGLVGMMYTFDWTCVECGDRNVFLRDKCSGCGALKELSVTDDDRSFQQAVNGDLRNCNSLYVSFAIPHSSYPSVALRSAIAVHPWRFYPDGYFYKDVVEPLLQFHLNKSVISMPPTKDDLRTDNWITEAKSSNLNDTTLHDVFHVPTGKVDEWYERYAYSLNADEDTTTLGQLWKEESEAWWNIDLDAPPPSSHIKYVHDSNTGGFIAVSKKQKQMGRTVPPERNTLPITPLPASVRNTKLSTGMFTRR
eukprot:TRINITY_DN15171_c0_g1_i1.p1 TRINITY_DN15171_c0_g1~~TRINITY_DN15171_c0_g1_i1.p1  ORF type:complete len:810 (+),score=212.30 TRINITY_DN15171_c0_g1_i1:152-2431(+)